MAVKFTRVSNPQLFRILDEHFANQSFRDGFEIKSIELTNEGSVYIFWTDNPDDFYVEKIH